MRGGCGPLLRWRSDFQKFSLLGGLDRRQGLDVSVGHLLDVGLDPLYLIVADAAILLKIAQLLQGVAADVAHCDPALLNALMDAADEPAAR